MDELRPGGRFGEYLVDSVLGQGGMGIVYRARHERLGRQVALKVLPIHLAGSAEYRARFQAEAQTLARLDSPHIIQVIDHGELDGALYIATQLVSGGDLAERLERQGPLPVPLALELGAQVVEAVGDAHAAGVLHRDVKPSNVLLAGSPERPFAYLCDFGIARGEDADTHHTATGGVIGTWSYLAPERIDGAPADRSTDIYALGCLLWAMLTGEPPYTGTSITVAVAHRDQPVRQLPRSDGFGIELNRVLARAMAKRPADRFSTAAELGAALRRLQTMPSAEPTRLPPMAPPPERPPTLPLAPAATPGPAAPAGRRRSRAPLLAVGAVLVVVVGVGGGALLATQVGDDDGGPTTGTSATPDPTTPTTRTSGPTESSSVPTTETTSETTTGETSSPPQPPEPTAVTLTVDGTCPSAAADCYLSVRSTPSTDGAERYRVDEGATLRVECLTPGGSYTVSRGTSDQWARTTDGDYAAALLLGPPAERRAVPAC